MNEYNVTFYAPHEGGFVLDIHASTGTSPCSEFASVQDLQNFFASQGIHDERLAEINTICSALRPGHAYHAKMFLPDPVVDAQEKLIAETGGLVDGSAPFNGPTLQATAQHA